MKICAAQTRPTKGNIHQNIKDHLALIDLASSEEVGIIVFPELSITGYEPTLAKSLATDSEDTRFDVFQEQSDHHNMVIAIGCPIKNEGKVSIGMIIFQPNHKRLTYLKKHLFLTEKEFFVAGDTFTNLRIDNTNFGLAICYELSVPAHQKVAMQNGAKIYLASVVETEEGIESSLSKMSKIASKYNVIALMSNCAGNTGSYTAGGKSSVWDIDGQLLGQLDAYTDGILIHDLEHKVTQSAKC